MKRDPTVESEKLPILVILHQPTSSAGRVGQLLQKMGFTLDIRRPVVGDALPDHLDQHSGAVVFGGPMSANDDLDFIRREIDWMAVPLKENKPLLGICLGAQMLARQIGGRVAPKPDGEVEMGWYPLEVTDVGRSYIKSWPQMVYHFHSEGIYDLPKTAQILARDDVFPTQAFCFGDKAWGIQFHAELTRVMMQRWIVHGFANLQRHGAQMPEDHIEGRFMYDHALRSWLIEVLCRLFACPTMADALKVV